MEQVAEWLSCYDVSRLTVAVRDGSVEEHVVECSGVDCRVVVKSGRSEFVEAVRDIAVDAKEGRLQEDSVDDDLLDSYLEGAGQPDLFVLTGREALVDSLIWGSVYSEVRFVGSWRNLAAEDVDSLVDDYRSTERRFGR